MARDIKITDLVDQKAFNQLRQLEEEFSKLSDSFAKLAVQLSGGVKVKPKTFEELKNKATEYGGIMQRLVDTQNDMTETQRKYLKVQDEVNKRMKVFAQQFSSSSSFQSFTDNVIKASKALESIADSTQKTTVAQNAGAQTTQRYAQAMQSASISTSLASKSYTEIINAVTEYDQQATELNRKLSENKTRLSDIRSQLSSLAKEEKRGALSRQEYLAKTSELTIKERDLMQQNRMYTSLLNAHSKVMVSTAGSYNEMSAAVVQLENRFKNLSAFQRQGAQGSALLKQIDQLKTELKSIDSQMGNYQRNVGNYTSHWNGLNMSVQQVARELPSLAVGWNTFFLAISNNLPILADELKKAKVELKEMQATGAKGVPIWKQLTGAVFNWQTALVVGITLLSVYGKDIINWVSGLFKAKNATLELLSAENQMALARRKAMESSARERVELDLLYNKLKDVTLSSKERNAAANEWVKRYPQYSNVLDGENVSLSNLELAYQSLSKQIIESAKARAYADKITDLQTKRMDALTKRQNQYITYLKAIEERDKAINEYNEKSKSGFGTAMAKLEAQDKVNEAKQNAEDQKKAWLDLIKVTKAYDESITIIAKNIKVDDLFPQPKEGTKKYWEDMKTAAVSSLEQINSAQKELLDNAFSKNKDLYSLGIDKTIVDSYKQAREEIIKAEKGISAYGDYNNKEKKADKYADYMRNLESEITKMRIAAIEDRRKAEIENVKAEIKERVDNIKGSSEKELELRLAYKEEEERRIKEINDKYNFENSKSYLENRISAIKGATEVEVADRIALQAELNEVERKQAVDNAIKTGEDVNAINSLYKSKEIEIYEKGANDIIKILEKQGKEAVNESDKALAKELFEAKSRYAKGEISKEEYEKQKTLIGLKYSKLRLQTLIKEAKAELAVANIPKEKAKEIEDKIEKLQQELNGIDLDIDLNSSKNKDPFAWYTNKIKGLKFSIQDLVHFYADSFSQLSGIMGDMYQNRIDNLENEIGRNEELYDAEIKNIEKLESSKAISKEEAEARKQAAEDRTIKKNEELEERKKQLQQKQARWEKANAITQTVISTAESVMKAYTLGPIIGAVYAAIVASLGAAQIATIAAQPIPKYAKGTDSHPGGLAIVGDGGKEEMIVTPSGKSYVTPRVPILVDLPKDSIVMPDLSFINHHGFRSDLPALDYGARLKGESITVNVNNDFKELKAEMRSLNKGFAELVKANKKLAAQADLDWMSRRV